MNISWSRIMPLGKQAKTLAKAQIDAVYHHLGNRRHALRDQTIFLLSVRAGLRAKEIANLRWSMIVGSDSLIGDAIHLTDIASKGRSGRIIPLNQNLRDHLVRLLDMEQKNPRFSLARDHVIRTERTARTSPQAIINMFQKWYGALGLMGCSSHSGRRTFITNAARKISTVGGSLRDVQSLAGHSSLQTTQRYIELNHDARRKIVDIV
jgi:integrase/recombinase XerD